MTNALSLEGYRRGRLVAIAPVPREENSKDGHVRWLCRCDCGNEKIVQSNNLTRTNGTKSCGCLRKDASAKRRKRDGSWNEGKSYAIGGGRHCYKNRRAWSIAAIRHYGNKCERCGWDKARCDVHHRDAKASGGLHTIDNAIILCPNCHRLEHEKT